MQAATVRLTAQCSQQEQARGYRIERQFSSQRQLKELVRDLLRAHSGE